MGKTRLFRYFGGKGDPDPEGAISELVRKGSGLGVVSHPDRPREYEIYRWGGTRLGKLTLSKNPGKFYVGLVDRMMRDVFERYGIEINPDERCPFVP